MPRREPRLTEVDKEKLEECLWVLLAVQKFGSVGDRVELGQQLEAKGLIRFEGSEAVLTPEGEEVARRFQEARGR